VIYSCYALHTTLSHSIVTRPRLNNYPDGQFKPTNMRLLSIVHFGVFAILNTKVVSAAYSLGTAERASTHDVRPRGSEMFIIMTATKHDARVARRVFLGGWQLREMLA